MDVLYAFAKTDPVKMLVLGLSAIEFGSTPNVAAGVPAGGNIIPHGAAGADDGMMPTPQAAPGGHCGGGAAMPYGYMVLRTVMHSTQSENQSMRRIKMNGGQRDEYEID